MSQPASTPVPRPPLPPTRACADAPGHGARVPVLVGRRADDGWRCALGGVAGRAGVPVDRALPLATTLGDLLAARACAARTEGAA